MKKVVRTICQGCHSECGVQVHTDNGKVIKITGDPNHPSSQGFICIKGKTNVNKFKGCEIVIEAAIENLDVKRKIKIQYLYFSSYLLDST